MESLAVWRPNAWTAPWSLPANRIVNILVLWRSNTCTTVTKLGRVCTNIVQQWNMVRLTSTFLY